MWFTSPDLFVHNATHVPAFYVEDSGKINLFHSAGIEISNLIHNLKRKLMPWTIFSRKGSAFLGHVFHVVIVASKKQMIWANTSSIVAFVTNTHSFWNCSKMHNPRGSVGLYVSWRKQFSIFLGHSPRDCSIPIVDVLPYPARFGFCDATPKPICEISTKPLRFGKGISKLLLHIKSLVNVPRFGRFTPRRGISIFSYSMPCSQHFTT